MSLHARTACLAWTLLLVASCGREEEQLPYQSSGIADGWLERELDRRQEIGPLDPLDRVVDDDITPCWVEGEASYKALSSQSRVRRMSGRYRLLRPTRDLEALQPVASRAAIRDMLVNSLTPLLMGDDELQAKLQLQRVTADVARERSDYWVVEEGPRKAIEVLYYDDGEGESGKKGALIRGPVLGLTQDSAERRHEVPLLLIEVGVVRQICSQERRSSQTNAGACEGIYITEFIRSPTGQTAEDAEFSKSLQGQWRAAVWARLERAEGEMSDRRIYCVN